MDPPSLSISNDPHHPPQFTPYPSYPPSNSFVSGASPPPNHPYFVSPPNPYTNHVYQPQPQPQPPFQAGQPPSQPSPNQSAYIEMICAAIAALNEPDGSSKMAISRYIERTYPGLTAAHGALLTHHLKSLKANGILTMVKKSYKLAVSSPPESVAVAAAAAAAGLEPPRSEIPMSFNNDRAPIDPVAVSASQPLKRGRGRPPKPKPEPQQPQQQQAGDVQANVVQSNGQQSWEQQYQMPVSVSQPISVSVSQPTGEVTESAKRGPGRPRKNGAGPVVQGSGMAGIMKRRGRPPGRRAAGRQRKPNSVPQILSVFPYGANGVRRRGRPRRVETSGNTTVAAAAPAGGEIVPVAPGMKRGRGRPPKIGGVINRLITKPKRGRGRPVGRPRKFAAGPVTGTQDPAYGELKKKFDLFQEKAKEILNVLKAEVKSDNEAVVRAIQDLEGLTVVEMVEPPQAMEEVQPEEAAPPTDAETQGETGGEAQGETKGVEQGQEREGGGGEEAAPAQIQTEAEAMQEALF